MTAYSILLIPLASAVCCAVILQMNGISAWNCRMLLRMLMMMARDCPSGGIAEAVYDFIWNKVRRGERRIDISFLLIFNAVQRSEIIGLLFRRLECLCTVSISVEEYLRSIFIVID